MFAAPLHAKALNDGLQVEHLLDVARDELADFVDHKHKRQPRLAALHELACPFRELGRRDVGLVLDSLHPRVRHRIRVGIQAVKHAARLGECEGDLPLLGGPVLLEEPLVLFLKAWKQSLLFEPDLQLRKVEVLRVAKGSGGRART